MNLPESAILSTAVALGVGLLIGTERERSKGSGPDREIAGVRTFALVSLLGLVATFIDGDYALPILALLVGALAIAGYLRSRLPDPGITTEIALLVVFVLGALSAKHPSYSAGVAVLVTVLLASRPWLHDVVKRRINNDELWDGFTLAAAALIVLPLLPDRTVDPWDVFNPHKIWIVVVMVMAVNALGYVGLKIWGPTKGLMLAGFLGGLVSSAATHGAMAQRSTSNASLVEGSAAAATFSSVTTAVFLLTVVLAVNPDVASGLILPCIAAAVASAIAGVLLLVYAKDADGGEFALGRPISIRAALIFGATLSGVLIAATLVSRWLGPQAALASSAIAGFGDAHSSAIATATLARERLISPHQAELGVLLGYTANAITKTALSAVVGSLRFALWVGLGLAGSTLAAWIAWLLFNS